MKPEHKAIQDRINTEYGLVVLVYVEETLEVSLNVYENHGSIYEPRKRVYASTHETVEGAWNHIDSQLRPIESVMMCVVDSHNGIYCPQLFVDRYRNYIKDGRSKDGVNIACVGTVLEGPHHFMYWDCWDEIERNVVITDDDGIRWTIRQLDDVFLVREDITELESEHCPLFN